MNHNYCVIMAGGAGTRLWPISRSHRPKQFLGLYGDNDTFVRITYDRFAEFMPAENILVVTTELYKELVKEQIPELPDKNLIVEPYARNTAPCVLYSAYTLYKRDPEAVMVVSPADHSIDGTGEYQTAILASLKYASENEALVALGVKPTRPDINYGYIQTKGKVSDNVPNQVIKVKTFIEKPDTDLAKVFVESGEFLWNAGIFAWKAETIIREMEKHVPVITTQFKGWQKSVGTPAEEAFIARAYTGCQNISVDYAVMEKTDIAWLYPVSFDWVDIGSWESLMEVWTKRDANGNGVNAETPFLMDCKDNLILSNSEGKLVAIRGLEDYVVVDTKDVLFICPKNDKNIKEFVTGIAMPEYSKYK